MAFLDKVTDMGRTAAKKSEEMMDVAKTKLKISENKSIMKDFEIEIGKLVYAKYQKGEALDVQLLELCEKIKEKEAENSRLESAL
ncbi:hypothetical protein [Bacilliculturomica massiliensis]|uniref:hypothetical protein n=1 Tax=Bacilliculturomica massiliensis TaxID=1917867 RepID=UPI001030B7B6|nr:hypothetical protein [Bacilliculturomica massiliensis]